MMRRSRRKLDSEFYAHAEQGFDLLAATYDEEIGTNAVGSRMRAVFRTALREVFRPGQFVFEIGCGTGIDALWMAEQGMDVVATDLSGNMVDRVRRKAEARGVSSRIRCRKLAARDIGALADEFGAEVFDGGYCHAGALNMEPELASVPHAVRALLKPAGHFVCSVINKTSLFEVLFYSAILRPRKAFRRLDNVIPIPISRREPLNRFAVPARFFTSNEVVRVFGRGFTVRSVQGLQVFLPPSNLTDQFAAAGPIFAPLEFLEEKLSRRRPTNAWGHHTILTFQRS